MAVISKDLGAVTAYAAAVNRGYTGTKEEFETLMASYATVAQQAAESAGNASQSATNASQSAQNAETAKGTAQQAATDAQTAQASAQGYAQSAQQSAQSASQSATDAESAKQTAVSTVDGFDSHAQQALDSVNQAGVNWKSLAQAKALDSEAYALGTRDGEDVGSSDPAYNNNAKWYALTAATDATTASDAAQTATQKAGEAQASAEAAAESARMLTIDATLTQSGQAADAKRVGDKITGLKEDFDELWLGLNAPVTFENGTFSTATGAITSANNRVVSSEIHLLQGDRFTLKRNASNLMQIFGVFNASKTAFACPVSASWALADIDWVATYECYLIVQIRTNTNDVITPEDISPTINVYRSYKYLVEKNIADISALDHRMDDIEAEIDGDYEFNRHTKASEIWTVEEGYYAASGGKAANADYILLEYVATRDFDVYCDPSMLTNTKTVYIAIYNDATIMASKLSSIYKLTSSENTMPTESTPATVYAGQILTISIYTPESDPRDIAVWADIEKGKTIEEQIASKIENFAQGKKIAWFGDSVSELRNLPHTVGSLMSANVYDCSIRGSVIGRTYSNYNTFSFCNLVTAIIDEDFTAQFAQLDAYEQAQGHTYPGIRENLTTLSTLDFDDVDYVVLLQGTNDFGIPINVQEGSGYANRVDEMQTLMDDAISRFITAYPKLKFYILSPFFRGDKSVDNYNNTLADYVEAERTVAEKYAIPFYDLLTHSRICEQNKLTYLNSANDLVHPNAYGDDWLAELSAKFISVN